MFRVGPEVFRVGEVYGLARISPPPLLEDGCVADEEDVEPDELEEDLEEPEDLDDDAELEDLDDEDLIGDEVLGDEVLDGVEIADDTAEAIEVPVAVVPDEDDDDDDDDEPEPDEIEATLDEILKERLVVPEEEDDDEEETPDADDRGDGVGKVLPKQPDEFVCQSCFLVKHPSQLADATHMWCRDCV
ncbi:MAG: hypothetical protein NVS3B12_19760 [Acidimicrobiales bacterium]